MRRFLEDQGIGEGGADGEALPPFLRFPRQEPLKVETPGGKAGESESGDGGAGTGDHGDRYAVPRAKRDFDTYAGWMKLPESEHLTGKNQAQMIDLYKTFRMRAGLGFERDVYLEQEPGDREVANEKPIPFAVLVHNLRSAFNVGSIIRSTDCFGLEGVHLSGYSTGPDHVTVKSAARGCQEWIPIKRWDSPFDCVKWHKENGYEIIALETGEDIPGINEVSWPKKGLIILGNEELGIAPELMAEATMKVTIPMAGRKASMNVAGAFAIMAFKIRSDYTP